MDISLKLDEKPKLKSKDNLINKLPSVKMKLKCIAVLVLDNEVSCHVIIVFLTFCYMNFSKRARFTKTVHEVTEFV